MPRRLWFVATLAVAAVGLTACSSSPSATPATASTTPATAVPTGPIAPATNPSPAGTFGIKPAVTVPTGSPPTQLQSTDLITGTGPAVKAGDSVTVQYVGVQWSNGQQFDASWNDGPGQPVSFSLNQVIPGWSRGMVDMKVGGRRELVIPPSLAYGAAGQPPVGPNATLIFIVDLYKIN